MLEKRIKKSMSSSRYYVDQMDKNNRGSVSALVEYDENNEETIVIRDAFQCFGWNANCDKNGAETKYQAFYIHNFKEENLRLPREIEEAWIFWVMSDSPWAGSVVNNLGAILNERVVIMDATIPSNIMYAAAFCIRMVYERPIMVRMWYELVSGGYDPITALVAIHSVGFTDVFKATPQSAGKVSPAAFSVSDHMVMYLGTYWNKPSFNRLKAGKIVHEVEPLNDPHLGHINMVQSMFFSNTQIDEEKRSSIIEDFFKKNLKKPKTSNNPFLAQTNSLPPFKDMNEAVAFFLDKKDDFMEALYDK